MLEAIDHINIVVRDLDKMIAFYRDVLGFELTKDVTISGDWVDNVVGLKAVEARVIYLTIDQGTRIELIEYRSPTPIEPGAISKPQAYGIRHMAFRVGDIDKAVARLREAGIHTFADVQTVPDQQVQYVGGVRKRLAYFHDPEGNLLEFCEYK